VSENGFGALVSFHKALQLASLISTAYTEIAAVWSAKWARIRRRGHVRYGNPA
jgi:hypothetical protein